MAALVRDRDHGRAARRGAPAGRLPVRRAGAPGGSASAVADRGPQRRSGRPLVGAVVVLVLMATGGSIVDAVAGPVAASAPAAPVPAVDVPAAEVQVHLVRPGQTYWSIAEELDGPGDIRARVDALQAANDGRMLRAGDRLVIPGAAPLRS